MKFHLAVTLMLLLTGTRAVSFAGTPPAEPSAMSKQAATWRDLGVISHEVCKAPDGYGYFRDADGRLGGHLNLKALLGRIAGVGVEAQLRVGGRDWNGLLQKDLAGALSASNDCARQVFQTMAKTLAMKPAGARKALVQPSSKMMVKIIRDTTPTQGIKDNNGQAVQNYNSPSENTQIGPVSSTAQTGGFTGNVVVAAPPATVQEQQIATYRLQLELSDLALFPERSRKDPGDTILQRALVSSIAQNLYGILSRYYRPTIENQKYNPLGLWKFRVAFYEASRAEVALEDNISMAFGNTPGAATQDARFELLRYSVAREAGWSVEDLRKQAQFMYFNNIDGAEAAYQKVIVASPNHRGLSSALAQQIGLIEAAKNLLQPYGN